MEKKSVDLIEKIAGAEQKLTAEAKVVVGLFQEAQKAADPIEKKRLLEEFVKKLVKLLSPSKSSNLMAKDQGVPAFLLTGIHKYFQDDCAHLGGGTAGQRIYFKNYITIYNDPARAEQLGRNALKTVYKDEIALKSADDKPRWMSYPLPEGNDLKFGRDYWPLFITNFGSDIVDLLQDLEKK